MPASTEKETSTEEKETEIEIEQQILLSEEAQEEKDQL